jgi:sugar lactone lactonase YvrE
MAITRKFVEYDLTNRRFVRRDTATDDIAFRSIMLGGASGVPLTIVDGKVDFGGAGITNILPPTVSLDVATKEYVDSVVQGLTIKNAVAVGSVPEDFLIASHDSGTGNVFYFDVPNAIATTASSTNVVITSASHGRHIGDVVELITIDPFNGLLFGDVTGPKTITDKTDDTFTYVSGTAATATGSGGGILAKYLWRDLMTISDLPAGASAPKLDNLEVVLYDRLLIKDWIGADAVYNGLFYVYSVESTTSIKVSRTMDADNQPLSNDTELSGGTFVFVDAGDTQHDTGWVVTSPHGLINLGVDPIQWTQFSAAGVITAGAGLTKESNVIKVLLPDNSLFADEAGLKVNAGDGLVVSAASGGKIAVQAANSTITVGSSGIKIGTSGNGTNGQYLKTDGTGGVSWNTVSFAALSDVLLTSATANDLLRFNGTHWVNFAVDGSTLEISGTLHVKDEGITVGKIADSALDSSLSKLATQFADATWASAPTTSLRGISADSSGNLYAIDVTGGGGTGAIRKFTTSGVMTTFASVPNAVAITTDSSGNHFVTDANDALIYKVTSGGVVTTSVSSGLDSPYWIAIDSSDNRFVTNLGTNAINKITPAGVVTTVGSTPTNARAGLAVDATGNLYPVDQNNGVVYKMTQAGVVTTVVSNLDNRYPTGGCFDSAGNYYIGCPGDNTAWKYAPGFGSSIEFPTGLTDPESETVFNGYLYVANAGVPSIGKFQLEPTYGIGISTSGVTTDKIANAAVTQEKLAATGAGASKVLQSDASGGMSWVALATQSLAGLSDVTLTTPSNNNLLRYNTGTSKWVNFAVDDATLEVSGTLHVKDLGVTTAKLANSAVTVDKVADSALEASLTKFTGLATDLAWATDPSLNGQDAVADTSGNIFVINGSGDIYKITPTGTVTFFATAANAANIAIDSSNNMFAALTDGVIYKITPSGTVTEWINTGVNSPCQITFDNNDWMYVGNSDINLVYKISPSKVITTHASLPHPARHGLVADSSDKLFALNADYGIYEIATNGSSSVFLDTGMSYPIALSIDNNDNLYVGDSGIPSILKVTPSAVVSTFATTATSTNGGAYFDGALYIPHGTNVDKYGLVEVPINIGVALSGITTDRIANSAVTEGKLAATGAGVGKFLQTNGSGTMSWQTVDLTTITLNQAYKNDPDGSGAIITTDSSDGDVIIAGTETFVVTDAKGAKIGNFDYGSANIITVPSQGDLAVAGRLEAAGRQHAIWTTSSSTIGSVELASGNSDFSHFGHITTNYQNSTGPLVELNLVTTAWTEFAQVKLVQSNLSDPTALDIEFRAGSNGKVTTYSPLHFNGGVTLTSASGATTYRLPTDGAANSLLTTDGSGHLSWNTVDDSTLEVSGGTVHVKDAGIVTTKIADANVTDGKLASGVATAHMGTVVTQVQNGTSTDGDAQLSFQFQYTKVGNQYIPGTNKTVAGMIVRIHNNNTSGGGNWVGQIYDATNPGTPVQVGSNSVAVNWADAPAGVFTDIELDWTTPISLTSGTPYWIVIASSGLHPAYVTYETGGGGPNLVFNQGGVLQLMNTWGYAINQILLETTPVLEANKIVKTTASGYIDASFIADAAITTSQLNINEGEGIIIDSASNYIAVKFQGTYGTEDNNDTLKLGGFGNTILHVKYDHTFQNVSGSEMFPGVAFVSQSMPNAGVDFADADSVTSFNAGTLFVLFSPAPPAAPSLADDETGIMTCKPGALVYLNAVIGLGSNPLTTTASSDVVVVHTPFVHKLVNGDTIYLTGLVGFNGLGDADLDQTGVPVTYIDPTHFSYTTGGTPATGSGVGGGSDGILQTLFRPNEAVYLGKYNGAAHGTAMQYPDTLTTGNQLVELGMAVDGYSMIWNPKFILQL